jgi:hypothetical protein
MGRFSGVLPEPWSRWLIIVSAGQAYVVDPEKRVLIRTFGGDISNVLVVPELELLVIADRYSLEGLGKSGVVWNTGDLTLDGFEGVAVEGMLLSGEACLDGETWYRFEVNLETGEVEGGRYPFERSSWQSWQGAFWRTLLDILGR